MEKGLFSKKLFPDKNRIDEIILRNPSPFILQTTTKSSIPEVFIGRIDEIKIIGLDGTIYKATTFSNTISVKELKPSIYIIEMLSNQILIRQKIMVIN